MKLNHQPRPEIELPTCRSEIVLDVLSIIPVILTFAVVGLYWNALPDVVATHFDLTGKANGWSGKGMLWVLSFVSLATTISLSIMCQFPRTFNYPYPITEENAARQYLLARKFLRVLKFQLAIILFVAVWDVIQFGTGKVKEFDAVQLLALVGINAASSFIYFALAYKRR